MAARANLEAKLSADTSAYVRSMAQAQAKTAEFSAKSSASFKALGNDFTNLAGRLAGPLLGAVSIQGLAQITNELDEIGDSADNLEVSARFLGALGEAARLTGTDAATANTAMTRLLQTIGDARRGETAALDIFARLGIDVNELGSNEEAVYAVARALGDFETNAERASAAADLFGRQGKRLAELFAEGETGLRNQIAEVERAGLVYSNAAVSTGQATKDAGQNIGRFFKVGIAELGAGLAQGGVFLRNFIDEATTFGVSISEAADRANRAVVDMIDAQERAARAQEGFEPPRGFAQPSGGFGAPFLFGAPFGQEGFAEFLRFVTERQTLTGIPLSSAGPATRGERASQAFWENALRDLSNNRSPREDRGSGEVSGINRDTQLMLQELRRNTKALEQIEANTAPLRE
ncbi:MAG TPA: hypothetical protein VFI76_01915 [Terrimicrobiaceae bacterium]|nr:hypothetical protein [Terrimicrobiaceae bacterium]